MPQTLSLDFLLISNQPGIDLPLIEADLVDLKPGLLAVTPPDERPPAILPERMALGRILIHETLARVDLALTFALHRRPVLAAMPADLLTRLTRGLDPAWLAIIRAGLLSVDVHADVSDADRAWCLRWIVRVVSRVGTRLGAIVFDPAAQRLLFGEQFTRLAESGIAEHVTLHREAWGPESRWLHTHGLQKLGEPELEMVGVPAALEYEAILVLRQVVEALAAVTHTEEPSLRAGMRVECDGGVELLARAAQPDPEHAAPWGRLRLVTAPAPGTNPGEDVIGAILAAALAAAREAQGRRDLVGASRRLDAILAAAPGHPAALAARADLAIAQGEPHVALDVATTLSLLAPDDARGPFWSGRALAALGRLAEAQAALSRAVTLAPDLAEAYLARSQVRDRLGLRAEAQLDRARAHSLGD